MGLEPGVLDNMMSPFPLMPRQGSLFEPWLHIGANCRQATSCCLWVQRWSLPCDLFEPLAPGVGTREARLAPTNVWQVRDKCLTA